MSDDKVVETIYGKYHKFTIIKKSTFGGVEFWIRRDGEPYKGSYSSLSAAVEAAKKEG